MDETNTNYFKRWEKSDSLMKVDFFKHNINKEDIKRVNKVLKSIFLTNANITKEFENNFCEYLDSKYCIAVNSCTAALHLSLLALDIKEGDEVITTPMSFVATSNAILHVGAKPVFVDIEKETGNINADLIESAITEKTKAIIPVHLFGNMCDMKKIKQIANKHKLFIIEDAAHCVEGQRDGVKVGQLSHAACFSFYATKNITSGEGGAITTNDEELAKKLYKLRLHGINKDAASRYTNGFQHWDMELLGWKYNISDIQAALLIGQLEKIEKRLEKREKLVKYYEKSLKKAQIKFITIPEKTKSARHLFIILTKNRDNIIKKLQEKNIQVAVNYRAIHNLTYYKQIFNYKPEDFPIANEFGNNVISIPLYPKLKNKEAKYIVNTIKKVLLNNES